jgi:hypothetical protein
MEYWSNGVMEYWSIGVLEYWRRLEGCSVSSSPLLVVADRPSGGTSETAADLINPILHHSSAPILHFSITPFLHHSTTPPLHHSTTPFLHHSLRSPGVVASRFGPGRIE